MTGASTGTPDTPRSIPERGIFFAPAAGTVALPVAQTHAHRLKPVGIG
jgi:hypothetical protein